MATAPSALDGSGEVAQPSGLQMSIARDGTGGLVYLRHDPSSGRDGVFLSRLTGGTFGSPTALDGGLPGSSSQPVIAAGNNGLLLIAFVNDGTLETVTVPSVSSAVPAPSALSRAASDPAISANNFSEAYLVFTHDVGPGSEVEAAHFSAAGWSLAVGPLSTSTADGAGTGSGNPAVATAGDGVGIASWGEGGHVLSRKITGTAPSPALETADTAPDGCSEQSAGDPGVGTEGDSSYADVVFQETLTCAGTVQTRVFARRLRGSAYEAIKAVDGIGGSGPGVTSPAAGEANATRPAVSEGEYGRGLITAVRSDTGGVMTTVLGADGSLGSPAAVNAAPTSASATAVPAVAGLFSSLVAWEQAPGSGATADLRLRFTQNGTDLGPETVVSSPTAGPTDAADGLAAGGDVQGDAALAWLQGPAGAPVLYTEEFLQAPGGFAASTPFRYSRNRQPTLTWGAPTELWGGLTYQVSVDGQAVAQTQQTSFTLPSPLADGPHSWQVTATNAVGQSSTMAAAQVWIDATPPTVSIGLTGIPRVGSPVSVSVSASDTPPGGTPDGASGLARGRLDFGDGTIVPTLAGTAHTYARPGSYLVGETVEDRAGNAVVASTRVRIVSAAAARRRRLRGLRRVVRGRAARGSGR